MTTIDKTRIATWLFLTGLLPVGQAQDDLSLKDLVQEHALQRTLEAQVTRIRDGKTSITLLHQHNNHRISIHHGQAVINAIRFATACFGKGQFSPQIFERHGKGFYFRQKWQGQYYQPLTEPDLCPVNRNNWSSSRGRRDQTDINRMV